ncbi:ABC transporter G family member 23 isoform X2 [Folsomia candida]|nr:ABC transporter G family member 23 isoform X2 [Folsomia candida]
MPQEFSLLNPLTIAELLKYFGMIYGMENAEIENRVKFLQCFLDLPPIHSPIHDLSGGQKRRVSLATAMIHNPPLLVLDEPTVGLDPLLRQRIWTHLNQISKEAGTTIILSTHYIEETKRCDKIGFMRGGQLLAEDSPKSLMSKFMTDNMERVALDLCRQDEKFQRTWEHSFSGEFQEELSLTSYRKVCTSPNGVVKSIAQPMIPAKPDHVKILCALFMKWWHRQRRDLRLVVSEFLLPVMVVVMLQNIFGVPPKNVKMGVIFPNEISSISEYCNNSQTGSGCLENTGICNFLDKFNNSEFTWIPTSSFDAGLEQVKFGRTFSFMHFPSNFSSHLKNRMLLRNFADNHTIHGSLISVKMDESNIISSAWVKNVLIEKFMSFVRSIASACSVNKVTVSHPIKFNAIYGNIELGNLISYIQPGIIIFMIFSQSCGFAPLWVEDRLGGLDDRDYVAGVSIWHGLVSNFLFHSLLAVVEIALLFGILAGFYGMEIKGSWYLAMALVFLTATCGLTCSWMIAALRDGLLETIFIALFFSLTQEFSSGVIWPLEMSVPFYRTLAELFLPITNILKSYRSICIRGWGISHPQVANGFITASCWIVISIIITIIAEKRRHK